MGYLIDGYKIMGQEAKNYVVNHRAGIGTLVSVAGTIVSNVMSTKAGAKSARMIDSKTLELGRNLTLGEKVKLCWTNHIGSVATAGISCVGAGYSHNQHVKDFNKVATAYAGIKKLYDSSRKATREVLGEKKDAELQDKINKKYIEEHPEVKQKIVSAGPNPDPGMKRKFWEPVSGEILFTSTDRIQLALKEMRAEMEALKPRDQSCNRVYGIKLKRLFDLLDHQFENRKELSDVLMYYGFNKGSDNTDDDSIDAYFTPMILDEDTAETCAAINWDTSPSDMRYGNYTKL